MPVYSICTPQSDTARSALGGIVNKGVNELERVSVQLATLIKLSPNNRSRITSSPVDDATGRTSVVASTILSSFGDIHWFPTPEKLSSYFGLGLSPFSSGNVAPAQVAQSKVRARDLARAPSRSRSFALAT
ncbi:MAG: IS110 family transposase [Mesorhizobium sp.]|nr:MAG: IS110 family transposase [Mesorhizobium sp.]